MEFRVWLTGAALLLQGASAASGQEAKHTDTTPVIQPGAPGQSSKILSPETAGIPARAPSEADFSFMEGMIMHHSQAVEMTDLLRTRSRNRELQSLGKRIGISQTDEIGYMKQWLKDRGRPVAAGHAMNHMNMPGMDMGSMPGMAMGSMPMMPGMLTPQQMRALAKASGASFDHLFLTGMIQHHTGALIMVEDLFGTPGAGQDNVLFDFATDVDNTQRAEIDIMRAMLLREKK
jgi:uncharacterized protein (DUF305 family)